MDIECHIYNCLCKQIIFIFTGMSKWFFKTLSIGSVNIVTKFGGVYKLSLDIKFLGCQWRYIFIYDTWFIPICYINNLFLTFQSRQAYVHKICYFFC